MRSRLLQGQGGAGHEEGRGGREGRWLGFRKSGKLLGPLASSLLFVPGSRPHPSSLLPTTPPNPFIHQAGAVGSEAISRQVQLVLGHLEGAPDEVPQRSNCASTGGEDLIAHYLEAEIREMQGETRGCLGCASSRMRKVTGTWLSPATYYLPATCYLLPTSCLLPATYQLLATCYLPATTFANP